MDLYINDIKNYLTELQNFINTRKFNKHSVIKQKEFIKYFEQDFNICLRVLKLFNMNFSDSDLYICFDGVNEVLIDCVTFQNIVNDYKNIYSV